MRNNRLESYRKLLRVDPPNDGHRWGATITQPGDPDRMATVWPSFARAYIAHLMLARSGGEIVT